MTTCFMVEPTGKWRDEAVTLCTEGHRVVVQLHVHDGSDIQLSMEDVEWPERCTDCAAPIRDRFLAGGRQWVRSADSDDVRSRPQDFGPGAMWDADWMPDAWKGSDGRCLVVILPDNREWMIDSEASNCTRPGDRTHKCWVRHDEPPLITVDKNGNTCAAGAGSIMTESWHGFLRNGVLEGC